MRATAAMCTLLTIVSGACRADDLIRCSGGLVSSDMAAADFLKRCGEPASRSVSTQELQDQFGVKVGTLTTEIWSYDGDGKAPSMRVTVVDGRIQGIQQSK